MEHCPVGTFASWHIEYFFYRDFEQIQSNDRFGINPNRSLGYTYSKSPPENMSVYKHDMLLNESPYGAGIVPMHCTIRRVLRRSFRLIANVIPLPIILRRSSRFPNDRLGINETEDSAIWSPPLSQECIWVKSSRCCVSQILSVPRLSASRWPAVPGR